MSSKQIMNQCSSSQDLAQLCCTYAALILFDDGQQIDDKKMNKLISASGNKVESYWAKLMSKALNSRNVSELLLGGGAGQTVSVSQPVPETKQDSKKPEVQPKKEEPKVEEEDMDMGGLFD